MNYCNECGNHNPIIKNIIKGSYKAKRVNRCTCPSCGFEWTIESDYNEWCKDRAEEEIAEKLKTEKYAKSKLN